MIAVERGGGRGPPTRPFRFSRPGVIPREVTNGEGGIRTPDTLAGIPVFETGAFNRSATSPGDVMVDARRSRRPSRSARGGQHRVTVTVGGAKGPLPRSSATSASPCLARWQQGLVRVRDAEPVLHAARIAAGGLRRPPGLCEVGRDVAVRARQLGARVDESVRPVGRALRHAVRMGTKCWCRCSSSCDSARSVRVKRPL
jgi:hypothetical protein